MEQSDSEKGIFINGKNQIIEMLQFMDETERQKLLNNIKRKNSVMARELMEKSFSFNDLYQLSHANLARIFSQCNPAIIGLALNISSTKFQRKALQSIDRTTAEQAFQVMNGNLINKTQECKRAQDKIVQVAIQLSRRKQISI